MHDLAQASTPPPQGGLLADRKGILHALEVVWEGYDRLEVRAIHPSTDPRRKGKTEAGIFDRSRLSELVAFAVTRSGQCPVYLTLNPINPSFTHPATNRVVAYPKGLVGNGDIAARRWLFIDLDPIRPTNTSASNEQLENAVKTAVRVKQHLAAQMWPDPIECLSGNGIHLLYRIELPNDAESTKLVENALEALGQMFNTDAIKIDKVVANAGRIIKLYGTVSNKGPNTPETPHRLSKILSIPESLKVVSKDQLEALASKTKANTAPLNPASGTSGKGEQWPQSTQGATNHVFDLEAFLHRLGIPYQQSVKSSGVESFRLEHCPFNKEHGAGDSAVCRFPDGRLGFKCFHNSCADKHWSSLRALVDHPSDPHDSSPTAPATEPDFQAPIPKRLPPALKPVPVFDPAVLPDVLRGAAIDMADRLQCPIEYIVVSMLSAAGAVIGNKIGIYPRQFDETWEVYPALWGGIVGDPGSKKTPAIQATHKPLRHIEDLAAQEYAKAMEQYKIAASQHQADLKELKGKSRRKSA
jgi:hypothetical protein